MGKAELLEYVRRVARSIEENIERLEEHGEDEKIRRLANGIQTFYVSLFDRTKGLFQSDDIDEALTRVVVENPPQSPVIPPKRKRPMTRVNTGKGSPLKPRKVHVSQRQQRVRARRGFDMSEFGRESRDERQVASQSCTSRASDESPPSESSSPPQTPPAQATPSSLPVQQRPSPPPVQPTPSPPPAETSAVPIKDDGPLRLQVRHDSRGRGGVQRFQLLAAMSQDGETSSIGSNLSDQASDDELGLFAREIEHWNRADARIEYALRDMWYEISHTTTPDASDTAFLKTLVTIHNTSNAVANSMAHLKGYLVQQCHERENSSKEIEIVREEIYESLREDEYSEYMSLVTRCGCDECTVVSEFDDAYNRCREEGSRRQPLGERPIHCILVDSSVRAVRAKYKGLSASSLQKCHYFYLSTPKFSPPTLSTAIPTTVQSLTTAYIKRYAKSFDVTGPYPQAWYANETPLEAENCRVRVAKENVHLFDGDGGEILVGDDDDQFLQDLCTHPHTIRFRLPLCDAPEIRTAFKFKKRRGDKLTSVGTVEVGMEALRTARKFLFEATEVHLLLRSCESTEGRVLPTVEIDSPRYGRALCEMLVRRNVGGNEGQPASLSALLAREGYMFPCFRYGIDAGVQEGMEIAIEHRKGMFRLPDETRQPGFLPWDVKDGHPTSEPVPIRNFNVDDPEGLWFGKASTEPETAGSNRYYVELAESEEWLEASCFVQKSTIPGAGLGLFLKPHRPIPKGQFVCLYAMHSTTEEAMDAAGSSRDYAIQTKKANLWFDAESQDGVCLGRFANQTHVYESLLQVCELSRKTNFTEIREEDWKRINDADAQRATLVYEQRKDQLVLVAAKDIPRADHSHELFSHYGDLRTYWLPLIQRKPRSFPENLSSIVSWFCHASECNWTEQQKQLWLGTNN